MASYNPNNPSGTTGTTGTTGMGTTGSSGLGTTGTSGVGAQRDQKMSSSMSSGSMEHDTQQGGGVTTALGERLERAGDFLEDKGKGQFIADKLHTAGKYLQDNDARTMARSVDSAICAHPYRGILIGLGLGWVVGRFLSGRD